MSAYARGDILAALRSQGLRIEREGRLETFPIRDASEAQELGPQDLVVVAVKAPALAAVAPAVAALLGPQTAVLTAMNGVPWWFLDGFGGAHAGTPLRSVDADGSVARAIPAAQVVGGVVHCSCALAGPAHVLHKMGNRIILGEPSGGTTARLQALATALRAGGIEADVSTEIQKDIWFKLWGNMTVNPVSAITGATTDLILDDELVRAFISAIMLEAREIGARRRFGAQAADAGADAGPTEEVKQQEDVWVARCTERAGQNDHPVNCLTYSAADQFCRWRKRRLPTEAEWEAAAQGADQRAYPWGNASPDCDRACFDKNSECRGGDVATCSAGSPASDKTPTDLFGMAGNVAEWVSDGWTPKPLSGTDPRAIPFAKTRVVRGGDFFNNVDMLRSATRREVHPAAAEPWIGVRCAMDATPTP